MPDAVTESAPRPAPKPASKPRHEAVAASNAGKQAEIRHTALTLQEARQKRLRAGESSRTTETHEVRGARGHIGQGFRMAARAPELISMAAQSRAEQNRMQQAVALFEETHGYTPTEADLPEVMKLRKQTRAGREAWNRVVDGARNSRGAKEGFVELSELAADNPAAAQLDRTIRSSILRVSDQLKSLTPEQRRQALAQHVDQVQRDLLGVKAELELKAKENTPEGQAAQEVLDVLQEYGVSTRELTTSVLQTAERAAADATITHEAAMKYVDGEADAQLEEAIKVQVGHIEGEANRITAAEKIHEWLMARGALARGAARTIDAASFLARNGKSAVALAGIAFGVTAALGIAGVSAPVLAVAGVAAGTAAIIARVARSRANVAQDVRVVTRDVSTAREHDAKGKAGKLMQRTLGRAGREHQRELLRRKATRSVVTVDRIAGRDKPSQHAEQGGQRREGRSVQVDINTGADRKSMEALQEEITAGNFDGALSRIAEISTRQELTLEDARGRAFISGGMLETARMQSELRQQIVKKVIEQDADLTALSTQAREARSSGNIEQARKLEAQVRAQAWGKVEAKVAEYSTKWEDAIQADLGEDVRTTRLHAAKRAITTAAVGAGAVGAGVGLARVAVGGAVHFAETGNLHESFVGVVTNSGSTLENSTTVGQAFAQAGKAAHEQVVQSTITAGNGTQPIITGGGHGEAVTTFCFLPGTHISTPEGIKLVEELKAGDSVYSFDEVTKQKVVSTIGRMDKLSEGAFFVINGTIRVTAKHPFYVQHEGILSTKEVDTLVVGDTLLNESGKAVAIDSLQKVDEPSTVYNLINVEPYHNYFAEGMLVHNKGASASIEGGTTLQTPEHITLPNGQVLEFKNIPGDVNTTHVDQWTAPDGTQHIDLIKDGHPIGTGVIHGNEIDMQYADGQTDVITAAHEAGTQLTPEQVFHHEDIVFNADTPNHNWFHMYTHVGHDAQGDYMKIFYNTPDAVQDASGHKLMVIMTNHGQVYVENGIKLHPDGTGQIQLLDAHGNAIPGQTMSESQLAHQLGITEAKIHPYVPTNGGEANVVTSEDNFFTQRIGGGYLGTDGKMHIVSSIHTYSGGDFKLQGATTNTESFDMTKAFNHNPVDANGKPIVVGGGNTGGSGAGTGTGSGTISSGGPGGSSGGGKGWSGLPIPNLGGVADSLGSRIPTTHILNATITGSDVVRGAEWSVGTGAATGFVRGMMYNKGGKKLTRATWAGAEVASLAEASIAAGTPVLAPVALLAIPSYIGGYWAARAVRGVGGLAGRTVGPHVPGMARATARTVKGATAATTRFVTRGKYGMPSMPAGAPTLSRAQAKEMMGIERRLPENIDYAAVAKQADIPNLSGLTPEQSRHMLTAQLASEGIAPKDMKKALEGKSTPVEIGEAIRKLRLQRMVEVSLPNNTDSLAQVGQVLNIHIPSTMSPAEAKKALQEHVAERIPKSLGVTPQTLSRAIAEAERHIPVASRTPEFYRDIIMGAVLEMPVGVNPEAVAAAMRIGFTSGDPSILTRGSIGHTLAAEGILLDEARSRLNAAIPTSGGPLGRNAPVVEGNIISALQQLRTEAALGPLAHNPTELANFATNLPGVPQNATLEQIAAAALREGIRPEDIITARATVTAGGTPLNGTALYHETRTGVMEAAFTRIPAGYHTDLANALWPGAVTPPVTPHILAQLATGTSGIGGVQIDHLTAQDIKDAYDRALDEASRTGASVTGASIAQQLEAPRLAGDLRIERFDNLGAAATGISAAGATVDQIAQRLAQLNIPRADMATIISGSKNAAGEVEAAEFARKVNSFVELPRFEHYFTRLGITTNRDAVRDAVGLTGTVSDRAIVEAMAKQGLSLADLEASINELHLPGGTVPTGDQVVSAMRERHMRGILTSQIAVANDRLRVANILGLRNASGAPVANADEATVALQEVLESSEPKDIYHDLSTRTSTTAQQTADTLRKPVFDGILETYMSSLSITDAGLGEALGLPPADRDRGHIITELMGRGLKPGDVQSVLGRLASAGTPTNAKAIVRELSTPAMHTMLAAKNLDPRTYRTFGRVLSTSEPETPDTIAAEAVRLGFTTDEIDRAISTGNENAMKRELDTARTRIAIDQDLPSSVSLADLDDIVTGTHGTRLSADIARDLTTSFAGYSLTPAEVHAAFTAGGSSQDVATRLIETMIKKFSWNATDQAAIETALCGSTTGRSISQIAHDAAYAGTPKNLRDVFAELSSKHPL